jgi:hypothetical protein
MKFHAATILVLAAAAATANAAPPNTLTFEGPSCLQPGDTFRVDVTLGTLGTDVVGAQALLRYDANALQLLGQEPGDASWSDLIYYSTNTTNGTIDLAVGMHAGSTRSGVIRRLVFRARTGSQVCGVAGLVRFRDVPGIPTRCTTDSGQSIVPTLVGLPAMDIEDAPSITPPADVDTTVATGARFAAASTGNAGGNSACGVAATISFVRSDGALSLSDPFACNTAHTITWKATDACGRASTAVQQVIVRSHASDFNNDGVVDGFDLSLLLGSWGTGGAGSPFDQDGDGVITGGDLSYLLANWGPAR